MLYLKALHIIFVVTWFAGLFYMPRLFIYNTEAEEKDEVTRKVLHDQFTVMMKRLWFGITWPSAILTLILGPVVMFTANWDNVLFDEQGQWLLIKLFFVIGLYVYFFFLHRIFKQQVNLVFKYTSQQLRAWNEVATVFLIAIVMLATVKQSISLVWGLAGLFIFIIVLMLALKIYKKMREKN
ncbi:MAG: hypothetical protein JWQ96_2043 [Segetibacter sp.]|nr:hypothetical protein [Segetibacter sp.]